MSCATFVDTLLAKGLRKPAVEFATWVEDSDDLKWRDRKLEAYKRRLAESRTRITQEQIEAMAAIAPFKRLRPEQIAGAATEPKDSAWSVEFEKANELAKEVISDFKSLKDS